MTRLRYDHTTYVRSVSPEGNCLAIFIHGLGGTNDKSYWGRIPELLESEDKLSHIDFVYWKYHTSKKLFPNKFSWLSQSLSIAPIPTVVDSFVDDFSLYSKEKKYQQIVIFSHSLGGHIALLAAKKLDKVDEKPLVSAICLNGTPTDEQKIARIHTAISGISNPHVAYLANDSMVRNTIMNVNSDLQALGVKTWYMHNNLDLYVKHIASNFSQQITISGPHHWFLNVISRNDSSYKLLFKWLLDCYAK